MRDNSLTYWVLLPQMGISLVSWLQLVLSMNRYRGLCGFRHYDLWALLLFLHCGVVRWVASLSLQTSSLAFQILTAFVGSALAWNAFVIVFNEGFFLPSRQQWWALFLALVVTALWEVNNRLIVWMS